MKRFCIVLVALFTATISCTDRDDDVTTINIRIKNDSNLLFEEVTVGDSEEVHMNVASGDYSEYFEYETAYQYAFIRIIAGGQTFTLQPIDFVGEEVLPVGFYTYELNISTDDEVLLNFVVD
ncbi:hypothetical protein [Poritiphilus flavus]|uniref:Uncharacterized protein n=1 Tax=Poritiphilus flavus TaxID=2697053 RepID=A0A6L9EB35_9FLAO|nr:hypothetical protein [Poritiphilus flavus]NAS11781.1 hypothetical protein [Poritiphilus flavus]